MHLEVHSCDLALKHLGRVLECPRDLGRGLERESIRNLLKRINLVGGGGGGSHSVA